ncbi:hypothetical protein BDN72DRAFT_846989 [Pluteus cervinus]|uniref:Uncharacterized protein n=1 Tax=Pluteus cervinus TaxID=181527 RepID=A0ACD3AEG5_9AGAR|nr:hypothetical protein BDN72DRAFT_846989 [Pluteus cervinus]
MAPNSSTLPPIFQNIRNADINGLVLAFIKSNKDNPVVMAVVSLLNAIQAKFLPDLTRFTAELISTLSDRQFYLNLYRAIEDHIRTHPWATAFFVIGVIMMCNPIAAIGFGQMGPVAGSLAAAWQSTMGGNVTVGSAFAVLQSWGMTYNVWIPIVGSIISGVSVVAADGGKHLAKVIHDGQVMASAIGKGFGKARPFGL